MTILSAHVLAIKNGRVLLVKHGKKAEHLTGVYGIPGGRLNKKENILKTGIREFREETGLTTSKNDLLEYPNNVYTAYIKRKDGTIKSFTMRVFLCRNFSGNLIKTGETEPEWISIEYLDHYNLLPNVKKAILDALKYLKERQILDKPE